MKIIRYCTLIFLMAYTMASYAQVASKLQLPFDKLQNNSYGTSIANHGNFTIVGSYFQNNIHLFYLGKYVRTYTATDAFGFSSLGVSVAISQDFIVSGAYQYNYGANLKAGAAFVISKIGNEFNTTFKQRLSPSVKQDGEKYGYDVAISGNWLAVTSPERNNGRGAVEVFQLINGNWNSFGYLDMSHVPLGAQFGYSVAMDGDRMIVGAKREKAVYVYKRDGITWGYEDKINSRWPSFGHDVDICQKESVKKIIIGAPDDFNGTGRAAVYKFNNINWVPFNSDTTKNILRSNGFSGSFGHSVALERGWAVVGEIYSMKTISSDATGEVHHFAHENNMFVRKGTLLTGDGDKNTALGYAVDLQDQWVVATDKDFDAVLTRSGSEGVAYRTPFYDVFNNRDTRMGSDITDLNLSNEVSIYPNPASEKINISSNNTIVSVTAVNASSNSVKLSVENNTVDISQLPSGIYMLNIQTESNMVTEKLIVK